MPAPFLELNNLFCERDDRVLFEKLSFTVEPGRIVRIEGPNGSGKTTLLRILCGLLQDFEGEIQFKGQPLSKVRPQFFAESLYLGHQPGIKSQLTADENLQWMTGFRTPCSQSERYQALAQVGLRGFEDVPARALSAGQQRRIGLARLYLESLPLWLLDEPFTAIDRQGVVALEQHIITHAEAGGAVLITTHHEFNLADERLQSVHLGGPT